MFNRGMPYMGYRGPMMMGGMRSFGSPLMGALGRGARLGQGASLFGKLRGSFNFSKIISNTGKTLDVLNRGIPLVKQAGPMFKNMKTMFRLASAFKDESNPREVNNSNKTTAKYQNNNSQYQTRRSTANNQNEQYSGPNFFI